MTLIVCRGICECIGRGRFVNVDWVFGYVILSMTG